MLCRDYGKIDSGSPDDQHLCILRSIVDLWINISVHSFSKKWSDSLQANAIVVCHTKVLRKTLKLKRTDKDQNRYSHTHACTL